ncbi:MAG: hybrid sensor histidine kinase/response regulator [Acidimicrobiales bacterium]
MTATATAEESPPVEFGGLLLIEDDDLDAEMISGYLLETVPSWPLHRATTLAAGLAMLDRLNPDLVMVDLTLPDASGLDSVRAICERVSNTPVIVQSSTATDKLTLRALRLGAQDYLKKDELCVESFERSVRYAIARHRSQQELATAAETIAEQDADLGEFAQVVAHDLRAPVRTSRLLADRLLDRIETEDPVCLDLAGRLDEALSRVDSMILTMLDYAGLRDEVSDPEPLSLSSVVHAACETLEADLDTVDSDLAMPTNPLLQVWGHRVLLRRVFTNLVSNSIKYRRPNERLVMRFDMVAKGPWVDLTLVDNGLGIPSDMREEVFAPLQRAHHDTAAGLGFGLAICRRIVRGLGGMIWIAEDGPVQGTAVIVRLQRAPDAGQILL